MNKDRHGWGKTRTTQTIPGDAFLLAWKLLSRKLPRMNSSGMRLVLASCLLFATIAICPAEALWKAGVAKANITPEVPLFLAGYAGRNKPADGKVTDLWIKVLALEDGRGHRAIILSSDLLGIPRSIYERVTASLKEKFKLEPDQILLTASHTHCGPVLRGALYDIYPLDEQQRSLIEKYSTELEAQIIETTGRALADLSPARLAAGQGKTAFAVNRRNNPEGKVPVLTAGGMLKGPVDHDVPVLAVFLPDGKLKAVLFGYACHNTTMSFTKWCGDYAGYAQIALEKSHPEATAMFFMGCGADQNPLPRRQVSLAERYGNMLAAAVEETLLAPTRALTPDLKTSLEMVTLNFGPELTEAELERLRDDKNATHHRWATRLLADLKAGRPLMRTYPFPIQAWRFGDEQLLLTLGGEVVVDYALKFKKEFGPRTWVAGYCNDVMTYIPSLRVLKEGGYEGGGAMAVYGLPTERWADDVEELITAGVQRQVGKVRETK
jgi:neutral ceramidase